jgi:hypothetical protein
MLETERLQAQRGKGVYYDDRWMDAADGVGTFVEVYVARRHICPNTAAALFIQ